MFNLNFSRTSELKMEDLLIVFSGDEVEIWPVTEVTEEYVRAGLVMYPRSDVQKYLYERGRVFAVNVPRETQIAAERIAQLADSQILRNVFSYSKPEKFWKFETFAVLGLMVLLAVSLIAR